MSEYFQKLPNGRIACYFRPHQLLTGEWAIEVKWLLPGKEHEYADWKISRSLPRFKRQKAVEKWLAANYEKSPNITEPKNEKGAMER